MHLHFNPGPNDTLPVRINRLNIKLKMITCIEYWREGIRSAQIVIFPINILSSMTVGTAEFDQSVLLSRSWCESGGFNVFVYSSYIVLRLSVHLYGPSRTVCFGVSSRCYTRILHGQVVSRKPDKKKFETVLFLYFRCGQNIRLTKYIKCYVLRMLTRRNL